MPAAEEHAAFCHSSDTNPAPSLQNSCPAACESSDSNESKKQQLKSLQGKLVNMFTKC